MDDTEEIRHKDKLKAVVTPLISCNTPEGSIGKVRVPQERIINIQPGFFFKKRTERVATVADPEGGGGG